MNSGLTLRVMMGLPRSGKSTIIDTGKYFINFQVVCADDIRLAMGHQFEPDMENFVWGVHNTMVKAHMVRQSDIVIDSTNTLFSRFQNYKRWADHYGYDMEIWYVNTPIEVCLERNQGEFSVPENVIRRMEAQLNFMLVSDPFKDLLPEITFKEIKYET